MLYASTLAWIIIPCTISESPQHDCVNFICDHPDIRAISFVGGDPAGRHIYNRGSANGKRVQVFLRLKLL